MADNIRIGTRGSRLALWQAHFVKSRIESFYPDKNVEIITIKTKGDRITDRPLALIGGKGLFVKEIETRLLENEIDLAVHSMKDMPGELPDNLTIGVVPQRENPFDVLISRKGLQLSDYPQGARIGTSSLRRASQIKYLRPDLTLLPIRGNLDTRIEKLASGEFDAIVLAAAGLIRLGQKARITQYLTESQMIPAVGQGALCIETRKDDPTINEILKPLDHRETNICVSGERAFLKQLGGSCHVPVACFGTITGSNITLTGMIASEDGTKLLKNQLSGPLENTGQLGGQLADILLAKGGKSILENLFSNE